MTNENLVKLYTTLTTPNQALGGKAFFTPESLGGSADVFAEKLKDRANLDKLFTTITSPSDALGGKAFFTPESLGGNTDVFAEKIGFGAEKKNLIGSESTSGSGPSQSISTPTPKVSIDGDVKNAVISLEGAQMALVNKDKEIANLNKSLAGGRDVGGSFTQVDRNLEKVVDGLDKKLAKERQFIQNSVQSTITKVKPVLNKVIDDKINDATIGNFTKNIQGKIVPDELKINSYAEDIIKQTGLSEGKYVKDFIYNEIKANVANKLTQPKVEKIFNDLYKKKYGVSVEEDINKDFVNKFKDVNAVKAQAEVKVNTVKELAKTDFTNEMSVISSEFKAKADIVNTNYKQTTDQINKQAEALNAQYQSGALPKEQYSTGIAQLNSSLEANFKAYKGNFDQMADEFLKTQNTVASRYDKRLRRQYQEIDNAAKVEVENRLTKYKSQYKVPVELEERYRKTYQEAADKFKLQEGVVDYQLDKSKGAATVMGESLLSGLGQGIKGLSYMADFDLGKVYGEYLETAFRLSDANVESMKDLLDPIKLARSSGQTIGAMAPMLAGNALIATATAGTSIPVQLAMTGGFGFFMESMQMAGDMYDRKMQQTGIVADAKKAAAKVIQANTMLLPLYAFDGLPLISNATLGIKNRALRGLAKGGIETATEITQEVPQSAFEDVIYKNQSLTDVIDKFDVTKKENRDQIFNTVLNVIPSSVLMGSAPTFLGYANKPIAEIRGRAAFAKEQLAGLTDSAMEQFFYDMQLTKGAAFTKAFLSAAYSSGNVNEMQLIKLTNIVDKSTKVLEDAQELKLSNGESKVYAAYEFAADAYTKQAEAMEDGVAKEALLAKAASIKKQAVNYLNTKEGDYTVLVLPNGEQYVYQSEFFESSISNYNTLKNLIAKKLATAKVVSSSKEGDKVKARVTGYVRIFDSTPEDVKEFTEEEGGMDPEVQSKLDGIAVEMGELEISLEQQSLSPEAKQKIQERLNELDGISQELLAGNNEVEYVSEGDNFFKILLDGTKEPVTQAEFETAVSTPKPINEKNGEMVTVNFGGKAITGTVEVDEGGKASIYSGGVVYELPNETEYVDYASPVRISDTDGSIEFDGISYPEVRIESLDGTETAVLIDENGKPKVVKDPKIVEEFKYQITLANLAEITEEEAITLLSEYEQDSQTKVDDATEGGVNQANEQKRSEEDIKLQEAIDEIDLIELIALEELDNAESNAKLVEYKPANSKDTKVYLVKKNEDGTISATLDGKKVRRGAVLSSLGEAYDMQSKEGSKKLATKLQEQVNALKADVESKLFGREQKAEVPAVEAVQEPVKQEEAPNKDEKPKLDQNKAIGADEVINKLEEVTKGKDPNKSSIIGQKIITALLRAGLVFHGGESKITAFDASKIKGGVRANLGKGFYFGASFKPFDYGSKLTYIDLSKFNLINGDLDNDFTKPFVDQLNNFIKENSDNLSNNVIRQVMFANRLIEELSKPDKSIDLAIRNTKDLFQFDSSDIFNDIMKAIGYDGMQVADNYEVSIFDNAVDKLNNAIVSDQNKFLADTYAKAKQDNSNPKLVEVVDEILQIKEQNATQESNEQVAPKVEEPVKEQSKEPKKEVIKKDDSKPAGLSPLETKFKEKPESLSKDELKEVLDAKRERYKKAMATIEKGELEGDALKAKQKAVDSLENTIEDLVKRIDSKVNPITTTEEQLRKAEKEVKDYFKSLGDTSLGIAKTPEQMVQAMREDAKFFKAIVDFAYLSIKLRGLKTIEAFKAELEKQLGVKFDKLPQELKDAWNEAKKLVVDEKKQAPTVKQTIKEATEQKTSTEKVATFAEYMAAKYKGMAEGEKIGQQNRFEIIKEATKYVKQAVSSDVSRAKINSLINKAISLQNFDSVKAFAKYVDKLIDNQEYYAKVSEVESLASKLGAKVKSDKFGSIAPQVRRMISVNPEHLTVEGIDKYITLAKDLLSGKVPDVTNLNSTLEQLKAEERQFIEAKLATDLMDDKELVSLIDTMYKLLGEDPTKAIADGLDKAIPLEVKIEMDKAFDKASSKRSEIMDYVTGKKIIKSAKDYVALVAAIKQYNKALSQLLAAAVISPTQKLELNINPQGENLSLLEEALKEKLGDFRKSLADQIGTIIASVRNQYATGGIRAKLFSSLTDFEKKAYDDTIKSILTFPQEVLPDLDIHELNDLFKAIEQLNNGYISPKLLESLEIIEAKGYQNSIRENIDSLSKEQAESDKKVEGFKKAFIKSVGDFKGATALTNYLKTFDYKEISSYFNDAYTKVYAEYIYKPLDRAMTNYKDVLEEITLKVTTVDDLLDDRVFRIIKGEPDADVVRNVVGIFLIQADHLRNPEYSEWEDDKKDLVKNILTQEKNKKIEVDEEDLEFLKKAYDLIEGDITTPEGLQEAKDKFFKKEPLAKKLYDAIRSAINNDIAPMTKISIEREGGSLEVDGDYFAIQKRGKNFKEVENPFEDMTERKHSADFKRRDNATYRRTGDPFVMRDFNASRAFNNMAEAASRNYILKPVVTPFYRAVTELANEYEFKGNQDVSIFLNSVNDVVFDSMKMQFQREKAAQYKTAIQRLMSFQRFVLLTQVIRLGADLGGNMLKAATSMNPIEFSKYVLKSQSKLKKDEFVKLARLVNSPIVFKTSRAKIENVYSSKRVKEKKADALAGWADIVAASITWKTMMLKNFKEITGKELDIDAIKENPTKYYLENKDALLKAGYETDLFIDKKFVTQSDIGRAQLKRVVPFDSLLGLKIKPVSRTSVGYSLLNQMSSYLANDAAVMWAASKRLTTKGDVSGFIGDVFPILLSQAAYTSLLSFSSAVASIAGYSIVQVLSGDDDDEPILEYAKEEMDNFLSMYTDPKEFGRSYLISVLLTSMGKYAAVSRIAFSVGVGALAGLDINRQPDKRAKKEVTKQWNENYKVIQDKFYFRPYTIGQKGNKAIEPTAADAASAIPLLGFYSNLVESTFGDNPNKQNIMTTIREVGKDNPDKAAAMMGAVNFMTLTAIAFGSTVAPTINKISTEMSKVEARKYWEEKKKQGGKSNQSKNPFGSSGFGSKGLGGGL